MSCKNLPTIWFHKLICHVCRTWTTLIWIRALLGWVGVVTGLQGAPWAPLQPTGSMEVTCPLDPLLQTARLPKEHSPLCPWPFPPPLASRHRPQVVAPCPPLLEALGCIWTLSSSSTSLPMIFPREWTPAGGRWVQHYGSGANGRKTGI